MGKTLRSAIRRTLAPPSLPRAGGGLGITAARELSPRPSVAVICPTRNRPERLPSLYELFRAQDYPEAQLWVLDDSPTPSAFLRQIADRDPKVHYLHYGTRFTIGAARNELIRQAGAEIVAHFDDDDRYAPNYLSTMVRQLVSTNADFVKLSTWVDRSMSARRHFIFEGRKRLDNDLWGWGFSYVYRRFVATRVSFPEMPVKGGGMSSEDYPFVQGLRAAGFRLALLDGAPHLAEHIWHATNTTHKS